MSASVYKRHIERHSLSELMPHLAYDTEKSLYILNDGYVGFGFVSMPLSGVDDTVTQRLNAFLTFDYPEGSFIQIMLLASPDIRVRMEAMLNMRDVEGSKSLKKSAVNRVGLFVAATEHAISHEDAVARQATRHDGLMEHAAHHRRPDDRHEGHPWQFLHQPEPLHPRQRDGAVYAGPQAECDHTQAFGPLPNFVPKILYKKQSADILNAALMEGDRIEKMAMCIGLFANDQDESESKRTIIHSEPAELCRQGPRHDREGVVSQSVAGRCEHHPG